MAFDKEQARTPAEIVGIEVSLVFPNPAGEGQPSASFRAHIRLSNDDVVTRAGDLVPHISAQRRTSLIAFMQELYDLAAQQMLP